MLVGKVQKQGVQWEESGRWCDFSWGRLHKERSVSSNVGIRDSSHATLLLGRPYFMSQYKPRC